MPEPRWDMLGQGQFAEVAVKRATRCPLCTGGLERSIVNHPQHTHVHNPLQELSDSASDSSWDKAAVEIVPAGLLGFPCRQGGLSPGDRDKSCLCACRPAV